MNQLELYFDGIVLKDNEKLAQKNIGDGSLLYFNIAQKAPPKPKGAIKSSPTMRRASCTKSVIATAHIPPETV